MSNIHVPDLIGYFIYPSLGGQQTRSYFAAFPALLPVAAVLEHVDSGMNDFVSATAIFDGQSIPVIESVVGFGRILQASFSTRLQDIGRQIDLQWTLRFAKKPTIINYTHRIIVTGPDAIDPIPTLSGNPCNIPCENMPIDASFYSPNPLYFAVNSTNTQYKGFGFDSPVFSGNVLLNWCNLVAAGFIDIRPYTYSFPEELPIYTETHRFCLQDEPRTTSRVLIVEINTNFNSFRFGEIITRDDEFDETLCPVGNTAPDWQDIGLPECQPEPRTDCRKQILRRDENPLSATFRQEQFFIIPSANPNDCSDCPPTSLLPDYQDTGEWRCVQPALGRETTLAEKRQVDRNPFSATFGNDQWVSIGMRPDLCPIDTDPCNRELWVDVLDSECNIVTRCKFDAPRAETTRQKQQIQANDRLANVGTTRWVDLPPSPQDEIECPVAVCPVLVATCPEQIRCKFNEPRFESTIEKLFVDVNPSSPTFGQQVWKDAGEDAVLCPVQPTAVNFSLSGASPFAFGVPQDTSALGCRQTWFFTRQNNFGLFDFSAGVNDARTIKNRYDITRTSVTDLRNNNFPNVLPYWIEQGLFNNDFTRKFSCWTRIDDVFSWAKAYYSEPVRKLAPDIHLYSLWVSSNIAASEITASLKIFDQHNNLLIPFNQNGTVTNPNAAYNIRYVKPISLGGDSCGAPFDFPHRNNQVSTPVPIPNGYILEFIYTSNVFMAVGLYRHVHEIFINGTPYASQEGYILNTL